MRKLIPRPGSKLGPLIAVKGITEVARLMKVSVRTVRNWLEMDGVPVRRVLKLSEVLDIEPVTLFSLVKPINVKPKRVIKTPECIETLIKAYNGEDFTIMAPLTARSLTKTLRYYGDRVPILVDTLLKLHTKDMDVTEAAKVLGITKQSVHGLRARYGLKPGIQKKQTKALGRYKQNAIKNREVSLAVISGRMFVTEAVKKYGVALRSLHRYIKADLVDFGLNELSHWPESLCMALANEIEHELDRISIRWFNLYRKNGWSQANIKPLPTITDWRHVTVRRLLIAALVDGTSLRDITDARGGEPEVIKRLFDSELVHFGTNFSQLSQMSVFHQLAIAELLQMVGRV